MKKLIFIALVFLSISIILPASAFDIGATYYRQMNESGSFGPSDGVKITAIPETLPIYAWGSWEHTRFTMADQPMGYMDVIGIGLGVKKNIINGISLFLDGGWYHPQWYKNGELIYPVAGDIGEMGFLYLNEKYSDTLGVHYFDSYKASISGNFGGSFGAEWKYNLSKSFLISTMISYRILSLPMWVEGIGIDSPGGGNWCRYEDLSLSGVGINAGIVWNF